MDFYHVTAAWREERNFGAGQITRVTRLDCIQRAVVRYVFFLTDFQVWIFLDDKKKYLKSFLNISMEYKTTMPQNIKANIKMCILC